MKNKLISILLILVILAAGMNVFAAWNDSFDVTIDMYKQRTGNAFFEGEQIGICFTLENGSEIQRDGSFTYILTDGTGSVVENVTKAVSLDGKQKKVIGYNPAISDRYGVYTLTAAYVSGNEEKTKSIKLSYSKRASEYLDDLGYMCHFSKPDSPGRYARIEESEELIRESGAGWIRGEINWSQIETVMGKYEVPERFEKYIDVAVANGQKVLLMVTSGNMLYESGTGADGQPCACLPVTEKGVEGFANFCAFLARYFKGRVDTFEIWNEPDWCGFNGHYEWLPNETSWGWTYLAEKSSEAYANLIKAVYPAMKNEYKGEEDKLTVLSGGSLPVKSDTGYLYKLLSKEDVQAYMDGVAVHPYARDAAFGDICSGDAQDFTRQMRRVKSFTDKPIYLTEYGASSYGDSGNNGIDEANTSYIGYGIYGPEGQAAALVRAYMVVASDPQIEKLFIYNFKETSSRDGVEERFGVIDVDYTPKNAYIALSNMASLLANAEPVTPIQANETSYAYGDCAEIYEFADTVSGEEIFVIAAGGSEFEEQTRLEIKRELDFEATEASAVLDNNGKRVTVNAYRDGYVKVLDMYGNELEPTDGVYSVSLNPMYVVCSDKACHIEENGSNIRILGNNAKGGGDVTALVCRKNALGQSVAAIEQIKADYSGNYELEFVKAPGNVYEIRIFDGVDYASGLTGTDKYDITLNYYVNGVLMKDVSEIKPGVRVKAEMIIKDKTGIGDSGLIAYGCVYDNGSMLLGADTDASEWNNGETILTTEVTVGESGSADDVNFMLWDSRMKPILNMIKSE